MHKTVYEFCMKHAVDSTGSTPFSKLQFALLASYLEEEAEKWLDPLVYQSNACYNLSLLNVKVAFWRARIEVCILWD